MGSTTHIVDEAGAVQNRYEYDAWGNITAQEEVVPNRFKFTGQQLDPVTQQYYLRARFYNPVVARFTQEDTYRGDGLNLYVYCTNNPVIYDDPTGYALTKCQKDAYNKARAEGKPASEAYEIATGINPLVPSGVTYEGPLYRNVGTKEDGTPINPLATSDYTRDADYRYTQPGTDGLYFASSQHIVDAEIAHYGKDPYSPYRTTYIYDNVKLDNMLDVTDSRTRERLGVELGQLLSDDYTITHQVGEYAKTHGFTGVIAPSARGDGGVNLVIFNPETINFGTYTTRHEKEG